MRFHSGKCVGLENMKRQIYLSKQLQISNAASFRDQVGLSTVLTVKESGHMAVIERALPHSGHWQGCAPAVC